MTNRMSLDGVSETEATGIMTSSEPGAGEDTFRRVADMIGTPTRGADIWSEPEIKVDAEDERESTAAVALEDQEGIDDPVRMYLREIGKVYLLTAGDEKRLARQMEEGQHIEAIENNWRAVNGTEPLAVDIALRLFDQLYQLSWVLDLAVEHLDLPKEATLVERLGDEALHRLIDGEMDMDFAQRVASARFGDEEPPPPPPAPVLTEVTDEDAKPVGGPFPGFEDAARSIVRLSIVAHILQPDLIAPLVDRWAKRTCCRRTWKCARTSWFATTACTTSSSS